MHIILICYIIATLLATGGGISDVLHSAFFSCFLLFFLEFYTLPVIQSDTEKEECCILDICELLSGHS